MDNSGTILVVEVGPGEADLATSIERSIQVIQRRLDAIGVDGEVKLSDGSRGRFEVKIHGKNDLQKLKGLLFNTYKLEYRKLVSPPNPSPAQTFPTEEKAKIAATEGQEVLPYSEREEPKSWDFVIVEKEPVITGEHIRYADAVSRTNSDFDYQISFSLNEKGAERFGDWTAKNINNYLAVVLDGKVKSIAFIRSVITDHGEISGSFSKEQAEAIALILNSGYMPWELRIVDERSF
jgi:preprotein translocase subunit SecD